jgi:diguanylate cyclase (GGDEF)-like protein
MDKLFMKNIKEAWSATQFPMDEITHYAQVLGVEEARKGIISLSQVLLFLFSMEIMFFYSFGFDKSYLYTASLLAMLSGHIMLSARAVHDTRTLYLLGTVLLMISGTAFVLLTHKTGSMELSIFAGVILLFMVVPIVPWGLREALLVMTIIYGTFSTSFLLEHSKQGAFVNHNYFDAKTVWSVLLVMIGAAVISLGIVGRNIIVRKNDIRNRYTLEQRNNELMRLSNRDPLTGAWNRRYLNNIFKKQAAEWHAAGSMYHFAFLDMDNFKPMNDSCGHDYGDKVLRCLSQAFASNMQDNGYMIRMGGDEFALLFTADDPEALISDSLAETQKAMERHKQSSKLPISISVGLVSIPPGISVSQDDIYRLADSTLYRAKDRKDLYAGRANIIRCMAELDEKRQISVE